MAASLTETSAACESFYAAIEAVLIRFTCGASEEFAEKLAFVPPVSPGGRVLSKHGSNLSFSATW